MGYFSVESAVSQPICMGGDPNRRRISAKSVRNGRSPEILLGIVNMMATTFLSSKGHSCPP
jgi:hypothetical protein